MTARGAAGLAIVLALTGCLRSFPPGVSGTVDLTSSGTVDLTSSGADALRLVYLGSGGWILEHREAQVLTGPLFTHPGLLQTGLLGIRSDTAQVDRLMSRYDVSDAVAILVGHAHYDHLMDVPRVARRHAPEARILGSSTVRNTLGTWSGLMDRVVVVNDSAGDQASVGRWITFGRVRVMALRSRHAPHFDGYTLYRGTRSVPLDEEPAFTSDWLDGETFAYLVDFMEGPDSVAFRVYYQDAVAAPPAGFAPEALVRDRPVDVAIVVPATFDQVDWHPESLVENLRPRRVVLTHWEDFFVPITEPARSIRFTDLAHFEDRLDRVFTGQWWRPDLWTELLIPPS